MMTAPAVTTEYVPATSVRPGEYVARWNGRGLVPVRVVGFTHPLSGHYVIETTGGSIPTGFQGQVERVLFAPGEAPQEKEDQEEEP